MNSISQIRNELTGSGEKNAPELRSGFPSDSSGARNNLPPPVGEFFYLAQGAGSAPDGAAGTTGPGAAASAGWGA